MGGVGREVAWEVRAASGVGSGRRLGGGGWWRWRKGIRRGRKGGAQGARPGVAGGELREAALLEDRGRCSRG